MNESMQNWQRQHDKISSSLKQSITTILVFSLFCLVVLGKPDSVLISDSAQIILPFINAEITYSSFLVFAPIILVLIAFYLQIQINKWMELNINKSNDFTPLPFVFNLEGFFPRITNYFIMHLIVPIILLLFAWKSIPRSEGENLFYLFLIYSMLQFILVAITRIRLSYGWEETVFSVILFLASALFFLLVYFEKFTPYRTVNLSNLTFKSEEISKVNLKNANLRGTIFREVALTDVNIEGADLTNVKIYKSRIVNINAQHSTLKNISINDTIFSQVNLSHANIEQSIFKKVHFFNSDLSKVIINNLDLSDSKILNTKLLELQVYNSMLKDIYVEHSSFQNSIIDNTKIENANFYKSHLTDSVWNNNLYNKVVFKYCINYGVIFDYGESDSIEFIECINDFS